MKKTLFLIPVFVLAMLSLALTSFQSTQTELAANGQEKTDQPIDVPKT